MASTEHNRLVKMLDGVALATDVHHPDGDGPFPTLLQRTCYNKDLLAPYLGLEAFVRAGYRVVFQDCRGSGASEGDQDHFAESADGRTTADWIATQPWFDGSLGTFGSSYMAFTQWALAATRPPYLKAMVIGRANSKGGLSWFPEGTFALDIALPWTMTRVFGFEAAQNPELQERLRRAFMHLPLSEGAQFATGQSVPWWDRWMRHPSAQDPFWKPLDFSEALDLPIPILFLDGWYDYATRHVVREFEQRQSAGLPSRMRIGPGTHFATDPEEQAETIAWFDQHLKNRISTERLPVSIYVLPDFGWVDLPRWPPDCDAVHWHLQPGGRLTPAPPTADSSTTAYVYDPADPTPAFGGPSLRMDNCGPVNNHELEERDDVLTFTSEPLREPLLTIGSVAAHLYLQSDVDHLDVYLRLCEVTPKGESINRAEAIQRLAPSEIRRDANGVFPVHIDLWPVAQRFGAGERIRLQLSGGAHPMFARNPGSGETLAEADTLVVAHNAVRHDEQYPSHITLRPPIGIDG